MSNTPVFELKNQIHQQHKRIVRLERALRDVLHSLNSVTPPYGYGWRAYQIAKDALSEPVEELSDHG